MTNVKISELPAATTPLSGAEEIPLVQSGVTRKALVSNIIGAANQVVDTINDLKATPVTSGTFVLVNSYSTPGDGGGGYFYGVTGAATGTYVDNGGTIILPTGGDGSSAWLRDFDGVYDVTFFGAKGDGVTDDAPAIQATFNAIVASGAPATAYIPQGTYSIESTLELDGAFICLEAYALLDASAITNGAAISIKTTSNNEVTNYNMAAPFGRQAAITGNLRLKGPGYTYRFSTGILFNDDTGAGIPTGVLQNVMVSSFGVGVLYYNYAWGATLIGCHILNCDYNILVPGDMVGGGERNSHYSCLLANGFTANVQVDAANVDMYFTNCSLDYPGQAVALGSISGTTFTVTSMVSTGYFEKNFAVNNSITTYPGTIAAGTKITAFGTGSGGVGTYTINNSQTVGPTAFYGPSGAQIIVSEGIVSLTDCHIEGEHADQALFQVGPDNGASLVIRGGAIGLRSGYGQTVSPFKITQTSTNRVALILDKVYMSFIIAGADPANQYIVDTSGVANANNAVINIGGSYTYNVYTNASLTSALNNILADGSFSVSTLPDVALVEDTAAITNRLTGTNISLAQSTTYYRTAPGSLAARKIGANTNASGFMVMAKLKNPGSSMVGFRYWDFNQASLSGSYYIGLGWAFVQPYNANGVPTLYRQSLVAATNITPTSTWTRRDLAAGIISPEWATHAIMFIKLDNFATATGGYVYFDDIEITEM